MKKDVELCKRMDAFAKKFKEQGFDNYVASLKLIMGKIKQS